MEEGAECVCVAEIMMRSVGMPVDLAADSLASSSRSRGSMQLSTTTRAILVAPSSRTMHLAKMGSSALVAMRSSNMPLTMTGKAVGVMSMADAPAFILAACAYAAAVRQNTNARITL